MKAQVLFTIILIITLTISCRKQPEKPTDTNKVEIGNTTLDSVSYETAVVTTQLNNTGGNPIIQHGHCWSTGQNPDISSNHTSLGTVNTTGKFTSNLSDLTDGIKYYIRPYVTLAEVTLYGTQQEFTTLKAGIPVVTTGLISGLTINSVTISGSVEHDSGNAVTQRGICWDTVSNLTIASNLGFTEEGLGIGQYSSTISVLLPSTNYFCVAYAANKKGTAYGEVKSFTTLSNQTLPTVTTDDATNIEQTSATSGGNVTSDGGATVTARGVCWSTSTNPTLSDSYTTNGSGTGTFVSNITGLTANTLYYVRAYATNSVGTVYGNEITFTTIPEPVVPTVVTDEVTNITHNSATSGGNVTSDGGATVTARGVCWNTVGNPTLGNCVGFTEDGNGTGTFSSQISGLIDGTTYYIVAYATNEKGNGYGQERSFTTNEILFEDGFESYASGGFPTSNWSPWHNCSSDPTHNIVTTYTSYSGYKSLQVYGQHYGCWAATAVHLINSLPSVLKVEAYLKASGQTGTGNCGKSDIAMGLIHQTQASINYEFFSINFMEDMNIYLSGAGGGLLQSFQNNQWYKVAYELNRNNYTLKVWINDIMFGPFSWNPSTLIHPVNEYRAISISSGDGKGWADDIVIYDMNND